MGGTIWGYGVFLIRWCGVMRYLYAHTSGWLIKGVWENDLVKYGVTFLSLRMLREEGCPEEQIFETCKKTE